MPLTVVNEPNCPYLPGRQSRSAAFRASSLSAEIYHDLMDAGFRRSGDIIYQPQCPGCRQCIPLRVCVDRFVPSKSQRRVLRRNDDLDVYVGPARIDARRVELYRKYVIQRHKRDLSDSDDTPAWLYRSPVTTVETTFMTGDGRLLAVGICDVSTRSVSSVYFFFDPDEAGRSLGTFGALCEIDYARRMGIPYYYLGYWIPESPAMSYKANFAPAEVLSTDGVWRTLDGLERRIVRP